MRGAQSYRSGPCKIKHNNLMRVFSRVSLGGTGGPLAAPPAAAALCSEESSLASEEDEDASLGVRSGE